jgi:hypothetical protein
LLLLEIPAIRYRYGMFKGVAPGKRGNKVAPYPYLGQTVTISVANPAIVTWAAHGLSAGAPVSFQTDDTLPAPIQPGLVYFVLPGGLAPGSFRIAGTPGGPAISTAGSAQAGVHKATSPPANPLAGWYELESPMLWLSQRLGKNRERLGCHYPSDTAVSRHLAAAIWRAMLHEADPAKRIECPTLDTVIRHAAAEWPTNWSDPAM